MLADSVAVKLQPEDGKAFDILRPGRQFTPGYSGRLLVRRAGRDGESLAVYVDSERDLRPSTTYAVRVVARSRRGAELVPKDGTWSFTTEPAPSMHRISFGLDLTTRPVRWHGAFFSGFCKPSFCTSSSNRIPSYELMDDVRKLYPKAWSLQRDFGMTGMEHQPKFLSGNLANLVRERETRRITVVEHRQDEILLRVEDFFGHEQYGIPSARPVSEDYHPGDEVLIADGVHNARAKVLTPDDKDSTVLVSAFETPPGGWKLEYTRPLPKKQDPHAPGLFPPSGCYLRKFRPSGTPHYYWGRLDKEWDLVHGRFGRRLIPNFTDAPGDLSVDGRNWTTAKDYEELHDVVRTMTGHLIERYGDACLDFVWSVFNEPDLMPAFWRSDWNELQKFYDYTVDGILRAFEDHGYDSQRVFVGGLELGAIFGTHLKLREFLAHCSPRAQTAGALPLNAAFADPRLDGKRSKRIEELCRAHGGKGTPCDFVSIHAYNRSELMAAKLVRAKEMALEIDPEYYAKLWINSHESCPGWSPPPDPAASDSYLGNGYFPTWCADVARRQLQRAAEDARYAFGETILTFWPWPNQNFDGLNACTRVIQVDDNGDGVSDCTVTVPMPIFHFLGLLNSMGDEYWVRPEEARGGHVISGFASKTNRDVRVLVYSHHALDTQSRSDATFEVDLNLAGVPCRRLRVQEYRFDKDHNTYYRLAQRLRDRAAANAAPDEVDSVIRALETDNRQVRLAALGKLASLGPWARSAGPWVVRLIDDTDDDAIRSAAVKAISRIGSAAVCYHPEEVRQVEALAALRSTGSATHTLDAAGRLRLNVNLAGNGANFLVITPE
ncbi:MAG: HEAT repeat domain-containing protein [Phycisphaerae bacterium]